MERETRGKMGIRLINFVAGNQNICLEIKTHVIKWVHSLFRVTKLIRKAQKRVTLR